MSSSQLNTPDDIKKLGTILSFWAHPDDETFCCAGIMTMAVQNGQRVVCVTATKGEEGIQDESRWPREKLGEIRAKELEEAFKILGITEHRFLNYHDGQLAEVALDEGVRHVLRAIKVYQPDTILTFGLDGLTGHPDHQSVSGWVSAATKHLDNPPRVYHMVETHDHYERFMKPADEKFNIYFNIDKPPLKESAECDLYFDFTPEITATKCAALAAMPSQMERMLRQYDQNTLNRMFGIEAFVKAK